MAEQRRRRRSTSEIGDAGKVRSGARQQARRPRSNKKAVKITDSVRDREELGEFIMPIGTDDEGLLSTMLPTKVPPDSKMKPITLRRMRTQARRHDVVVLIHRGHDFQTIAKKLGYKTSNAVYAVWQDILTKDIQQPLDEIRKLEVKRLDAMLVALDRRISAGDLGAVDRSLKIQERRSKLLGLDAAVQINQNLTHEHTGGVVVVTGTPREYVEAMMEGTGATPDEIAFAIAQAESATVPELTKAQRAAHLALNKPSTDEPEDLDDDIVDAEIVEDDMVP